MSSVFYPDNRRGAWLGNLGYAVKSSSALYLPRPYLLGWGMGDFFAALNLELLLKKLKAVSVVKPDQSVFQLGKLDLKRALHSAAR